MLLLSQSSLFVCWIFEGMHFSCATITNQFFHFAMKSLNIALENVPKDRNGKISKEYLRVVLDVVAPSAGLPPIGAVEQVVQRHITRTSLS